MKKTLSLILFAAAIFAGCQKDLIETQPKESNSEELTTIVGYLDVDNTSKLSLVDGVKLAWAIGDQIKVNSRTFTVSSIDPDNPARAFFTGTAPTTAEKYRAVYPTLSYSSAGQFYLSDTQNYGLDDKVTNVNYMYAETTDYNEIHFHNVCGILTVDLKGEGTVSNIKVSADQYLSGTLDNVAISESGVLTYNGFYSDYYSEPNTYVNLGCGKIATLSQETARRFYIAVPENDYTNLKLAITTEQGTMVVPATKTASVKKNNIYHIPEITVDIKPLEFDGQIAVVKNEVNGTSLDFAISVTPADKDVYYIVDVQSPNYVGEGGYEFAKKDVAYYSKYSLEQLVSAGLAFKGDCAEFKPSYDLDINTDYVAYAYAVDEYFNVSVPIKLNVHTAKIEVPEHNANYSDYLGEWTLGGDVITVEALESGKTYKVTGIGNLDNQFCTIPYVTANFEKGNFVLNEQYTGKRAPVYTYGDSDFYLSGLNSIIYLPTYPFASENPSMILYGQYSNDKINVYSPYTNLGITWMILSGDYKGKGSILTPATAIPSEMKHPEPMPETLFGEWKVTDGYTDGAGNDRTGWIWTLSQDGAGVKINNFDPMLEELGASDYDIPKFIWDPSANTLTLPAGTETGYGIQWYGLDSSYSHLEDIVLNVDLGNGTITLANAAYIADDGYDTYTWYDAPLVFNKVASTSAMTKTSTATENAKVNVVARAYEERAAKNISNLSGKTAKVKKNLVR